MNGDVYFSPGRLSAPAWQHETPSSGVSLVLFLARPLRGHHAYDTNQLVSY